MRIVGIALVVLVLGTLFFLTEGNIGTNSDLATPMSPVQNDSAFKDLKIN